MNAFQWSCLICFLIGSSASDPSPVEVSAVLGEEVTFPVRVRDGFEIDEITWIFKGATIAKMIPGKNYTVRDARFAGRLCAADESGSIKIRSLRTEDSGLYTIEIHNKKKPTEKETKLYELEIFRSSAGDPSPVEVSAVLGEEVTFPVRVRDVFEIDEIACVFKGATISTMSPGKNYTVRDERFAGRLCAADESGSIKIRSLRTEDSGLYTIYIFNKKKPTEKETKRYELEIFSRVKSHISSMITFDSASGICHITFNCTVNDNTKVSYSWSGEKVGTSVEPVLRLNLTESASNQSVCCTVKNPVSNASGCVHPRGCCFPEQDQRGKQNS